MPKSNLNPHHKSSTHFGISNLGILKNLSGDEGETKRSKRREARKDPEAGVRETKGRSRGDPGKIHRSKGFGVQGCRRE